MDNNWEIFEIAPEPSGETYELIKKIYAKNGPVEAVYRKLGMKYVSLPFLIYKNGRLYVDKRLEKKTVPQTMRNIVFSGLIKTNNWQEVFGKIKLKLENDRETEDAEEKFLDDYQTIFEVNLRFEKSIKGLEIALKKDQKKLISLLTYGESLVTDLPKLEIIWNKKGLKGNSIEINDKSNLVEVISKKKRCPEEIRKWVEQLSEFRRRQIISLLKNCLIYSKLRERGRWLVVKNLAEIKKKKITKRVVKRKKRAEYVRSEKLIGVSAGRAKGVLVSEETIRDKKYKGKDKIIYCEVAKPELTELLGQVVGVTTGKGGLMSHLAIVAREMGIPMVVGFDGEKIVGEKIEIDGETGEVKINADR